MFFKGFEDKTLLRGSQINRRSTFTQVIMKSRSFLHQKKEELIKSSTHHLLIILDFYGNHILEEDLAS